MARRRIQVRFTERSDPEISESFAIVAEAWGMVYRDDAARTIVILPNPADAQELRDQIRELNDVGVLESWSEAG
jgi:hypothetical protein